MFAENGWGQSTSVERAHHWACRAAEAGYPPGFFYLAQMFERGKAGQVNVPAVIQNYSRASLGTRGFAPAATRLAEIYSQPNGPFFSAALAMRRAYRGYLLGDPMAAMLLGTWYEFGTSPTERDEAKALKWYEASAEMGNFLASDRLSMAFELGELGVDRDPEKRDHYQELFWRQVKPPEQGDRGQEDQGSE